MSIKKLVRSVLYRAGYNVVNKDYSRPLLSFFAALKKNNFQPKLIYDVGANHGAWTRSALEYFPQASCVLFEPQDHLKSDIADLIQRGFSIEWINAGVGSEPGVQWFTIAQRDDSSSFAMKADDPLASAERVKMDVTTLNETVARHGGAIPDMLKIDAEGWDFKVLEGASNLVGVTEIILMEGTICARNYENTALTVIQKLDQLGYRLIDITDLNRSAQHRVLWMVELAFLRKDSRLLDHATSH